MKSITAGIIGLVCGVGLTFGALHVRPFRFLDYTKTITRGSGDFTVKTVVEYRRDLLTGMTWWRYQDSHPRKAWAPLEPEPFDPDAYMIWR
jgi:hypothetical protein